MADKNTSSDTDASTGRKYNPPVSLAPLDFETAVEGLLKVDPDKDKSDRNKSDEQDKE